MDRGCIAYRGHGDSVAERHFRLVLKGMDIVMTGYAGDTGSAILARRFERRLGERLTQEFLQAVQYFYPQEPPGAGTFITPIGEGGVFAALWRLAEAADLGMTVELPEIPICQETIEICELLDITPYQLLSGGFLYITENGRGLPGKVIGSTNTTKDRIVQGREGTRYLTKPQPDELERIGGES